MRRGKSANATFTSLDPDCLPVIIEPAFVEEDGELRTAAESVALESIRSVRLRCQSCWRAARTSPYTSAVQRPVAMQLRRTGDMGEPVPVLTIGIWIS